jgi:hypothetical protein
MSTARKKISGLPEAQPWKPAAWEQADAYALQALARGECPPHLQQRALKFVIERLAGTYDLTYHPESTRDSDFAQGKRFVGLQIVKLLNLNLEKFKHDD